MNNLPKSVISSTLISHEVVDYYCQEFLIPPTDTYPQDLVSQARRSGNPFLVLHIDNDTVITIPLPSKALFDPKLAITVDLDKNYIPLCRIITNAFDRGRPLTDENMGDLSVFLGAVFTIRNLYREEDSIPEAEKNFISVAADFLRKTYPTLLYIAAKPVLDTENRVVSLSLFLYLDRTKPNLQN